MSLFVIFIIGVYLAHRTCIKDDICDYLSVIAAFIESHRGCEIINIGDFSCHFGDHLAEGRGVKHAVMVENSSGLLIRMTLL